VFSAGNVGELGLHDEFSSSLRRRVGFRTAELVRDAAHDGNGTIFAWRINGVLLYIRGANVIPFDVFETERQVGRKQYEVTLRAAADAHMSMVRCSASSALLDRIVHLQLVGMALLLLCLFSAADHVWARSTCAYTQVRVWGGGSYLGDDFYDVYTLTNTSTTIVGAGYRCKLAELSH
jgi:hypothetical protein